MRGATAPAAFGPSQPSDRAATSRTSGSRKAPPRAGTARASPSRPSASAAAVRADGVADESTRRARAGNEIAAEPPNVARAFAAASAAPALVRAADRRGDAPGDQ